MLNVCKWQDFSFPGHRMTSDPQPVGLACSRLTGELTGGPDRKVRGSSFFLAFWAEVELHS